MNVIILNSYHKKSTDLSQYFKKSLSLYDVPKNAINKTICKSLHE